MDGRGCITYMVETVPFMEVEDEPRIIEIVKGKMNPNSANGWIASGEVPEYKSFTKEPKAKRNRRHKYYGCVRSDTPKKKTPA